MLHMLESSAQFTLIAIFPVQSVYLYRHNKAELQSVIWPLSCIPLHLHILIYFLHCQVLKIKVQHVLPLIHWPELSQHTQIRRLVSQVAGQWKHAPSLWKDHILIKFRQLARQGFLEATLRMSSQTRTTKMTRLYNWGLLDLQTTKCFRKHLKILLRLYRVYSQTIAGICFNESNVTLSNRSSEYPTMKYRKNRFLSVGGFYFTRTALLVVPLPCSETFRKGTDLWCWLNVFWVFSPVRTANK